MVVKDNHLVLWCLIPIKLFFIYGFYLIFKYLLKGIFLCNMNKIIDVVMGTKKRKKSRLGFRKHMIHLCAFEVLFGANFQVFQSSSRPANT